MSPDDLAAWVTASCERHGVPAKITDAGVVAKVVVLMGEGADGRGSGAPATPPTGRQPALQPPDRIDPARVEATRPGSSRSDHSVVEDRLDDGVLPVQPEVVPPGGEFGAVAG